MRIDIASIKENIVEVNIKLKWCPGSEMLADCLSKHGANSDNLMHIITTGSIDKHFCDDRATGETS